MSFYLRNMIISYHLSFLIIYHSSPLPPFTEMPQHSTNKAPTKKTAVVSEAMPKQAPKSTVYEKRALMLLRGKRLLLGLLDPCLHAINETALRLSHGR
jgi:hypothetical protein